MEPLDENLLIQRRNSTIFEETKSTNAWGFFVAAAFCWFLLCFFLLNYSWFTMY